MDKYYINVSLFWRGNSREEVKADLEEEIGNPDSMLFQTHAYFIEEVPLDVKYSHTDKAWEKKLSLNDTELGKAYFSDDDDEDGVKAWFFTPSYTQYFTASQLHHIANTMDLLNERYPNPFAKEA